MPSIEFSAFRKFAEGGDKMLYVQGETLKGTSNQGNMSAHVFKAATDEFVAAFKKHYGVQFESSLRQFLTPELTEGKPLTARTIKVLIDFADKKMGSATSVDAGGRQVNLETLGLDKMRRVGVLRRNWTRCPTAPSSIPRTTGFTSSNSRSTRRRPSRRKTSPTSRSSTSSKTPSAPARRTSRS